MKKNDLIMLAAIGAGGYVLYNWLKSSGNWDKWFGSAATAGVRAGAGVDVTTDPVDPAYAAYLAAQQAMAATGQNSVPSVFRQTPVTVQTTPTAGNPGVALTNNSGVRQHPNYAVGDSFTLIVYGAPNKPVAMDAVRSGQTYHWDLGSTNSQGVFTLRDVMGDWNVGSWVETVTVDGVRVGQLSFAVQGQGQAATITSNPASSAADPTKVAMLEAAAANDPWAVNGLMNADQWNFYRNALFPPDLTPAQFGQAFPSDLPWRNDLMTAGQFMSQLAGSGLGDIVGAVPKVKSLSFAGPRSAFGGAFRPVSRYKGNYGPNVN